MGFDDVLFVMNSLTNGVVVEIGSKFWQNIFSSSVSRQARVSIFSDWLPSDIWNWLSSLTICSSPLLTRTVPDGRLNGAFGKSSRLLALSTINTSPSDSEKMSEQVSVTSSPSDLLYNVPTGSLNDVFPDNVLRLVSLIKNEPLGRETFISIPSRCPLYVVSFSRTHPDLPSEVA